MKNVAALFLAATVALLAGCSSQSSSASNSNTQTAASAASNGGCDVDANQICAAIVNQPILDAGTGQTLGNRELAERSARTASLVENVQIPNGSLLEVGCETNAQHNAVTYAHLLRGAALTPTDIAWLKAQHLCK
jgi:hypothetical protein